MCEVTRLVFGTSGFGGFLRLRKWDEVLAVGKALVRRFGPGVTWDSANMYGAGMALGNTGNLIRALGIQDTSKVINKPGWVIIEPPPGVPIDKFEPGLWRGLTKTIRYAQTRAQMRESIDQGLQFLGPGIKAPLCSAHDFHKLGRMIAHTPDLFLGDRLLTSDANVLMYDELLPALAEKRAEGAIKGVGLGMMDWRLMREIITRSGVIDYVMLANEFTILRHDPDLLDFIEWLREKGIGLIVAAPYHAAWIFGAIEKIDGFTDPTAEQVQWRTNFLQVCAEMKVEACRSRGAVHLFQPLRRCRGSGLRPRDPHRPELPPECRRQRPRHPQRSLGAAHCQRGNPKDYRYQEQLFA